MLKVSFRRRPGFELVNTATRNQNRSHWYRLLGMRRWALVLMVAEENFTTEDAPDPIQTLAGGRLMKWNANACLVCLAYAHNGGLEACRTTAEAVARDHQMSYTQEELNEAVNNLLAQYHANGHTFRSADV